MPELILRRTSQWQNKFRKIGIYLDNENIGTISDGDTRVFSVEPGLHTLKVKIDWCSSRDFNFSLTENDSKTLQISGARAANLFSVYYLAFAANDYLQIREIN